MRTASLYSLGLIVAGLLLAGAVSMIRTRPAPVGPEVEVLRAAQAAMRRYLASDLKTSFSDLTETTIEALPDRKWRVAGWVDVIDRFGHVNRQSYYLRLYKNASGNWVGEDIFVSPLM